MQMKSIIVRFLILASVAAAAVGCSYNYSALLRSGDHDLMFKKAIEYYDIAKYQRSIQLLEEAQPYLGGSNKEDSLLYYLGASYYKQGNFESSALIFEDLRRRWGRSPFLEDAEYMYAKGFFYSSPDIRRDQTATVQAIGAINEYLRRYPDSEKKAMLNEHLDELYQKLHDKAFFNARTYYNIGRYKSAVVAFKNALDKYPDSNHREEILYLTTKSSYLLAKNSLEKLQRDRYLDMLDNYYTFVSEYPGSANRKEVDKMQDEAKEFLAQFADDEAGDELVRQTQSY